MFGRRSKEGKEKELAKLESKVKEKKAEIKSKGPFTKIYNRKWHYGIWGSKI